MPLFNNNPDAKKLRKMLFERYASFSLMPIHNQNIEQTGWERVDRTIEEMNNRLKVANTEEKYQAIGMLGRETLISIAQQVFLKEKHPSVDGTDISPTDAKRMLNAYISYELNDESEKVIRFVKSAVDMSNQLTHDRNATYRSASICVLAVSFIANLIKHIKETEK